MLGTHSTFSFTRLWDLHTIINLLSFSLHLFLTRSHSHNNKFENFRISKMSVPELPYSISSPEEAFQASTRRINILLDELCSNLTESIEEFHSDLNKGNEIMVAQLHERNQTLLQNYKLKMKPLWYLYFQGYFPEDFRLSWSSSWSWSCPGNFYSLQQTFQYWPSHITPSNSDTVHHTPQLWYRTWHNQAYL